MRRRHKRLRRKEIKKRRIMVIISMFAATFLLASGYAAFSTSLNINAKGNLKIDENCVVNKVWEYDYEDNNNYDLTIPCTGIYKLETWGSSGGYNSGLENTSGGFGGYATGLIKLNKNQKIFIQIGETGKMGKAIFNGGGYGKPGGGGATSITTYNRGQLMNYANFQDEVLIVSGGGGGDDSIGMGGCGGGFKGCKSSWTRTDVTQTETQLAYGGTQTEGGQGYEQGSFGQGGGFLEYSYDHSDLGGAGGGGWYGGGSGGHPGWSSGGGGSGYIGNQYLDDKSMYCFGCEESLDLTKPEIFTVSTTGDSEYKDTTNCPNGYDENPISKCAKKGNGYAKITLISIG